MNARSTRLVQFALSLSLTTIASAAVAPIATLTGDAGVTVNGKQVTRLQPAYAGDIIETPGSLLGIIQLRGQGLVRVSAAGRVSLEKSGKEVWLGLQRGYLAIHESAPPVSVRAHGGKSAPIRDPPSRWPRLRT